MPLQEMGLTHLNPEEKDPVTTPIFHGRKIHIID